MFLDAEEARKKTYREKLEIGFIVAQAHEDKSWEIYYESAAAL
jgi:NOL1/NOP2/fmu family ribosome biogenesis protein